MSVGHSVNCRIAAPANAKRDNDVRSVGLLDVAESPDITFPSDSLQQRRALSLDAAVDGAADWVQNSDPVMRARKEKAYLRGLNAYRAYVTQP